MISRFFGFNFDFAGAITASLCAVHCTVFPILLSLGLTSTSTHSHTFDFAMMSVGVLIAGYSLVRDYLKTHKNPQPLFLALAGFIILFIGIETHGELFLLNIIGGLMIVGSHLLNWRLSHSKSLVKS
ncbi:MAG: hypothetical protein ACI86M_000833 [Saprospiraceae bacterium]|jgi:hypothetical protein